MGLGGMFFFTENLEEFGLLASVVFLEPTRKGTNRNRAACSIISVGIFVQCLRACALLGCSAIVCRAALVFGELTRFLDAFAYSEILGFAIVGGDCPATTNYLL